MPARFTSDKLQPYQSQQEAPTSKRRTQSLTAGHTVGTSLSHSQTSRSAVIQRTCRPLISCQSSGQYLIEAATVSRLHRLTWPHTSFDNIDGVIFDS